jgi:hypothetical protein
MDRLTYVALLFHDLERTTIEFADELNGQTDSTHTSTNNEDIRIE